MRTKGAGLGDPVTHRVSADPGLAKSVLVSLPGGRQIALEGRTLRLTAEHGEGLFLALLRTLDAAGIVLESIRWPGPPSTERSPPLREPQA
jgi:hypothetical protein